jgi:hypothetical protein
LPPLQASYRLLSWMMCVFPRSHTWFPIVGLIVFEVSNASIHFLLETHRSTPCVLCLIGNRDILTRPSHHKVPLKWIKQKKNASLPFLENYPQEEQVRGLHVLGNRVHRDISLRETNFLREKPTSHWGDTHISLKDNNLYLGNQSIRGDVTPSQKFNSLLFWRKIF